MAQIVEGGNATFDALVYGAPHPGTMQFLSSQFNAVSNNLTQAGERFMEGARDLYERFNNSQAMQRFKAVKRSIRSMWQMDDIRPLRDIGEFQHATPTMQRWIMAEPTGRRLYHQQRLDGFSDSYVDVHPGLVGEEHYDYRRAMDGLIVLDEEDEEDENGDCGWIATTYFDELLPGDEEPTLAEQVDIQNVWDFFRAHLKAGKEDPTSRYNADLM